VTASVPARQLLRAVCRVQRRRAAAQRPEHPGLERGVPARRRQL